MKTSVKRILSAALALTLMLSLLPTGVLAANETFSVEGMNSLQTISQLGDGGYALKTDGSLWTWSTGWAYADAVNYPEVTGGNIEGQPYNTNSDFIKVSEYFGLKSNGELWAWGNAVPGDLDASKAVKVAENIAMIDMTPNYLNNYIAMKTDGKLVKWSSNPTPVGTLPSIIFSKSPEVLLTNVVNFATDGYNSQVWRALKSDGTLWYCDSNGNLTKEMDNVAAFSNGVQLNMSTLAIKTDGTLWAWGDNTYGQVGNGGKYTSYEPQDQDYGPFYNQGTPVKILDNVVYAETGYSSFAITSDGTLYGWGKNDYNQLGFTGGNAVLDKGYVKTVCQNVPKVITNNAAAVASDSSTTIVLKRDGSLWSCGSNMYGVAGQSNQKYSSKVETLTKMMDGVALPKGMVTSGSQVTPPTHPTETPSNAAFSDTAGHWANEYIKKAADNGLINGVGNGKFEPDRTVSNAEWATMICNLMGYKSDKILLSGYWWSQPVSAVMENDVFEGTMIHTGYYLISNQTESMLLRHVNEKISRFDMAQVIYNIGTQQGWGAPAPDNTSASIADWNSIFAYNYNDAVAYCYANGFITGVDSKGTFDGKASMTRAAAATVLCRLLDVKERDGAMEVPPTIKPVEPSTPETPVTPENQTAPTTSIEDYRQQVFELTNAERANVGAAALNYNSDLSVIAQARAEALAELGSLPPDHNIPGMGDHNASLRAFGFKGATYAGENCTIAATPDGAIANWLASTKGHKQNMLGQISVGSVACKWTDIGIGCAQGDNGTYYWVQIFVQ